MRIWIKSEIKTLIENVNCNDKQIQEQFLPNRTINSIMHKRQRLNYVRKARYNEDESKYVKRYYFKKSPKEIAKKLGKSEDSVRGHAYRMNLLIDERPKVKWTIDEDKILIKYYGKMKLKLIKRTYLPYRSISSIQSRADNLGLKSNRSLLIKGENNPFWKRKHCSKTKKRLSENRQGTKNPSIMGNKNPAKRIEVRAKMSIGVRMWWANPKNLSKQNIMNAKRSRTYVKLWENPEYSKKQIGYLSNKPTSPEIIVKKICESNNLPFKYVGDYKFKLRGKYPDFVDEKSKKIIEVNGEHWHQDKNKERRRKYLFNKCGFKTLIIWEKPLKKNPQKVTEKIINFHINN